MARAREPYKRNGFEKANMIVNNKRMEFESVHKVKYKDKCPVEVRLDQKIIICRECEKKGLPKHIFSILIPHFHEKRQFTYSRIEKTHAKLRAFIDLFKSKHNHLSI